jgi:hypothetical protein
MKKDKAFYVALDLIKRSKEGVPAYEEIIEVFAQKIRELVKEEVEKQGTFKKWDDNMIQGMIKAEAKAAAWEGWKWICDAPDDEEAMFNMGHDHRFNKWFDNYWQQKQEE